MELAHLEYVSERHGPMGDTMDKHGLQDPLDVVEGVTHAGQAATGHTYMMSCDYIAKLYSITLTQQ